MQVFFLSAGSAGRLGGSDLRRSVLGKDDSGVTREKMNLGEEEEIEMR